MSSDTQVFWDDVHRGRDRSRQGTPHPYVVEALGSAAPGRALDLGTGDGTTAVWLASLGWTVTAVDVSRYALDRATELADRAGVASRITWEHADLSGWTSEEPFDLVVALFLQSPLDFDGPAILARAASTLREGGTLLSVSHFTVPPSSWDREDAEPLPSAAQLTAALGVDRPGWRIVVADEVPRTWTGAEGEQSTVLDAVVHAVRVAS